MRDTVGLFLLNQRNDYQSDMHRGAVLAARRYGLELEVHDAATSPELQAHQVRAAIEGPDSERMLAALVHPVFDGSMEDVARVAAGAGIGWALLNRASAYVDDLHRRHPDVPIFSVTPDQQEIGRAQGRIVRTFLPQGGKVVLVLGPFWAASVRLRRAGLEEALQGTGIDVYQTYGDWSADSGEHAIGRWELLHKDARGDVLDVVVAQNDAMGAGARRALAEVARRRQWPRLAEVPVVGCDGTRALGLRLVNERTLAATVVVPGTAAPAIDLVEDWRRGRRAPAATVLPVSIYPDLAQLAPLAAQGTSTQPSRR